MGNLSVERGESFHKNTFKIEKRWSGKFWL